MHLVYSERRRPARFPVTGTPLSRGPAPLRPARRGERVVAQANLFSRLARIFKSYANSFGRLGPLSWLLGGSVGGRMAFSGEWRAVARSRALAH